MTFPLPIGNLVSDDAADSPGPCGSRGEAGATRCCIKQGAKASGKHRANLKQETK